MNKFLKRIAMILMFTTILTTVNCFAVSIIDEITITKDGVAYIQRVYEVQEKEESKFLSTLERQFTKDDKDYVVETINKSGGNITDTIDIHTTKEVTTKSNNTEAILQELPETIEYSEDGYIGQYTINVDSLEIVPHYNGHRTILIEEVMQYYDLNKNDLSYIPKQIKKDGATLDLIKITWHEQTTKLIGDNIVPDKYRAECYYATKKRVDNPATYTTTVSYTGTATKVTEIPFTYDIEYKCITEDSKTNFIPYILGGTGAIFTAVAIFFRRKSKKDKEASSKWKKD